MFPTKLIRSETFGLLHEHPQWDVSHRKYDASHYRRRRWVNHLESQEKYYHLQNLFLFGAEVYMPCAACCALVFPG